MRTSISLNLRQLETLGESKKSIFLELRLTEVPLYVDMNVDDPLYCAFPIIIFTFIYY